MKSLRNNKEIIKVMKSENNISGFLFSNEVYKMRGRSKEAF
jgi:hypothetical protein